MSTFKWDKEDLHLQSIYADAPALNTYTFYIMGPDQLASKKDASVGMYWTTLPSWPTPKTVTLYLTDERTLDSSPPQASYVMNYIYDPNNPVPTYGGNNLFEECGPLDQTPIEIRPDVLLFTSDAMMSATVVMGSMQVNLFVSSNCTDTDFTVKVTDVYPSGSSVVITDTMLRMRWRDSRSNATLMEPGKIYNVTIKLWETAQVFDVDHRIRLAVSSSNYPRFGVNLNNGLLIREGGETLFAENTVYVGPKYPSSITIPTVSFSQIPPNIASRAFKIKND
jgi:putative CocE/NonD family hydrolase